MAPKTAATIAGTKRMREASAIWLAGGKAGCDEKDIDFGRCWLMVLIGVVLELGFDDGHGVAGSWGQDIHWKKVQFWNAPSWKVLSWCGPQETRPLKKVQSRSIKQERWHFVANRKSRGEVLLSLFGSNYLFNTPQDCTFFGEIGARGGRHISNGRPLLETLGLLYFFDSTALHSPIRDGLTTLKDNH